MKAMKRTQVLRWIMLSAATVFPAMIVPTFAPAFAQASKFSDQATGPIVLDGKSFPKNEQDEKAPRRVAWTVDLPTPGVWYVWLRVSTDFWGSTLLTYDFDGEQLLHSARKDILIQPFQKSQWISQTRYPDFKIEVHADEPGEHELGLTLHDGGDVTIEKVALTLYHGASPDGDTLRMVGDPAQKRSDDPAQGRITFARSHVAVDGFRPDWESPRIKAAGTSYYIDSDAGSDDADGMSAETAWKTFYKVNMATFEPGDAILLKRGGKWTQNLAPRGNGTPEQWITIGAYGEGDRPYINGGNRPGVSLTDQNYWVIQDLSVTNDPEYKQSGIAVIGNRAAPQPTGIRIFNCLAFDTGDHGILVGSDIKEDGANGYDGVLIENCKTFWNARDGIVVRGTTQDGCRNTVIRYCTAFSNPGMAGIWIHSGQNGLIENCLAYNNACINIWTWNSINVTVRYCEAFRGRGPRDRGGFDIDWGCEACTLEYCYSHHNEGVGFLVMGSGTKKFYGFPVQSRYNLMRYCVSEYDNPGIGTTGTLQESILHNNTIYTFGRSHGGEPKVALSVTGWPELPEKWTGGGWPSHTLFANNILMADDGAVAVYADHLATNQGNVFNGNLYWRADGGAPLIRWGGNKCGDPVAFWQGNKTNVTPPDDFNTLADFQHATGQEDQGCEADPMLKGAGNGGYGRVPLDAYKLLAGSPAIGAGITVDLDAKWLEERRKYLTDTGAEAYGIPMEPARNPTDFWGNPIPSEHPSIGADQPR